MLFAAEGRNDIIVGELFALRDGHFSLGLLDGELRAVLLEVVHDGGLADLGLPGKLSLGVDDAPHVGLVFRYLLAVKLDA